jgi:hypothetical protein
LSPLWPLVPGLFALACWMAAAVCAINGGLDAPSTSPLARFTEALVALMLLGFALTIGTTVLYFGLLLWR